MNRSLALLIVAVLIVGCSSTPSPTATPTVLPVPIATNAPTAAASLPNPASANCGAKGGRLDIRTDAGGGQVGVCVFSDGSECEEWALFRNECQPKTSATIAPAPVVTVSVPVVMGPVSTPAADTPNLPNPASANCIARGGALDIRKDASGGEVGYCEFPDGSECEEWALMRGECQPGGGIMPVPPPETQPKRIVFPAGGVSAVEQGSVAANETFAYVVRAMAGQTLSVKLTAAQGQAILIIWGADGNVLISDHAGATEWSGVLPSTQDYNIHVRSVTTAWTDYWLEVTIPSLAGSLPQPEPQPKPIIFQPGAVSAMMEDSLAANGMVRYSIHALAGQTMSVNLTPVQGSAILIIWGADGNVLISDHAGVTSWSGVLPTTQDYFIDVRSVTNIETDYWLQVTIPPL